MTKTCTVIHWCNLGKHLWETAGMPGQWKRYQPPIFTTRKAGPRLLEEDRGALRPFFLFR